MTIEELTKLSMTTISKCYQISRMSTLLSQGLQNLLESSRNGGRLSGVFPKRMSLLNWLNKGVENLLRFFFRTNKKARRTIRLTSAAWRAFCG